MIQPQKLGGLDWWGSKPFYNEDDEVEEEEDSIGHGSRVVGSHSALEVGVPGVGM